MYKKQQQKKKQWRIWNCSVLVTKYNTFISWNRYAVNFSIVKEKETLFLTKVSIFNKCLSQRMHFVQFKYSLKILL